MTADARLPAWYPESKTWIDVFVDQTRKHAEREFLKFGSVRLTYADLRDQVEKLATGLLELGARPGGTVALWMSNCPEWIIAQWATYRIGCQLLPLSSYLKLDELRYALEEAQPSILIVRATFISKIDARSMVMELLPELERGRGLPIAAVPSIRAVVTVEDWGAPGCWPLGEVLNRASRVAEDGLEFARSRTTPMNTLNIMYTSGTTGRPKAGLMTHRNTLSIIHLWAALAGLGEDDVVLCQMPLFGNIGCMYSSALTLFIGGRLVLTEKFDPALSLGEIEEEHVTYLPGTPEMFRMLFEDPAFRTADISSLSGAHIGGSALSPELAERVFAVIPNAMPCYGLSECGGPATATGSFDDPFRRAHSVGRPLASLLLEIRDPETGSRVAHNDVGEIWLADALPGSCVGHGYLASPEATAAAITADGWFRTGDLGRVDEEGYLYFVGRRKNMFTVGGFNVYPAEIEATIQAIDGVDRAFVVGIPDERLGSVPAAFIVASLDTNLDSVTALLRERLSSQKLPRRIWRLESGEVPVTPNGKVRRGELEEMAAERQTTEGKSFP